ncbi:hypothetical protein ACTI_36620 [Actinoplanes sp. OR16]|uniref:DUF262 domain-containing protein n=1 Tax=Actinoplanes sp. OR16 TaxID=946334 RepID=UPI000F70D2AA|nr:DUF262 domain-containing protein [Actinoplanes sp. OR16]BBH66977.1 hypothetical protein ACTI_36620 [Actinoplanes sp. OR16]
MAEAFVFPVAEIVRSIDAGRFRLPPFQRPYVWTAEQAIPYFDSLLSGLPTGVITVLEGPAERSTERIGPARITAPPDPAAWWVVDGHQRLGALAGLLRQGAVRLAYDLAADTVIEHREPREPFDMPFEVLTDSHSFESWLSDLDSGRFADRAIDVRRRLLDSRLMLVRLSKMPPTAAADVFLRLNNGGVRLTAADQRHARRPDGDRAVIPTLDGMAARLAESGFGHLPAGVILQTMRKISPSATDQELREFPDPVQGAAEDALRRALRWLIAEAGIPHLTVWEQHLALLPTLAWFFDRNPAPSPRARLLLNRWLWRSMGNADPGVLQRPLLGADSLDATDLLRSVPTETPDPAGYLSRFGERLALTTLAPRSLLTAEPLPVADLLQAYGHSTFRTFTGALFFSPPDEGPLGELLLSRPVDPGVIASHAIDGHAVALLRAGFSSQFRRRRTEVLAESLFKRARPRAQWGASDRPAISDLLVSDDDSEEAGSHGW